MTPVPIATNTSWIDLVESQALYLQDKAVAGGDYRNWEEANEAFQPGEAMIYGGNQRGGMRFRDGYNGQRKHRGPL